ncbi:MAG: phosphoadenosine phosphosulfate reductase family protein [Mariprofundales bacterium]
MNKTLAAINDFAHDKDNYFIGISWGKDSVVLADMFYSLGYRPPNIYIRNTSREAEGHLLVRDEFIKSHPSIKYSEISYCYTDSDSTYYNNHGAPVKWYRILKSLDRKYSHHVTGIRYDESSKRKRRFDIFGLETVNTFAPFRWFTCQDIFAYLYQKDLPIHPNYAMSGGGRWDKYRIRVAAIGNKEGDGMGRGEWEKEYYQDIVNKIAKLEYDKGE